MLSRFFSRITLIAAATPLTAVMVHSQSLPQRISQIPNIREALSNASVPVCYIQLENGQIRDLRQLCGKKNLSPPSSRRVPTPTARPDDDDDDEPTPTSASTPQVRPSPRSPNSTSTPTSPTPQPSAGSLIGTPGRSINGQPFTTSPSSSSPGLLNPQTLPNPSGAPNPSGIPNPLAIPDDEDRY